TADRGARLDRPRERGVLSPRDRPARDEETATGRPAPAAAARPSEALAAVAAGEPRRGGMARPSGAPRQQGVPYGTRGGRAWAGCGAARLAAYCHYLAGAVGGSRARNLRLLRRVAGSVRAGLCTPPPRPPGAGR